LSNLNSILPFFTSSTACSTFCTTVQALGDGIKPLGQSCLATTAKSLICSGVVINISKSNFHAFISFNKFSVQAISAQAFFISAALSSEIKTAIFFVFPVQ
jgi:hypothetical protein